jgi:hypothetical protein
LSIIGWYFGEASPWASGAFALAGAAIGAVIAGTVSLKVARETSDAAERVARATRDAAEQAWVRDSRREIYDRFLTAGQRLLAVMEKAAGTTEIRGDPQTGVAGTTDARGEPHTAVDEAYAVYFATYASVQTVAELDVVKNARNHAYRLQALKDILDGSGTFARSEFGPIAKLVRDARHDTIDAMRDDLRLHGSARPPAGTDYAQSVASAVREGLSRPVEP